jgi:DNA-binding NarL/FixJ family response regulator
MALKIFIAEGNRLMCEGLVGVLEETDGMTVVGKAHSGPEVLGAVARSRPDIVVLDLGLPGAAQLSCLELLHKHHPSIKVVIFSDSNDRDQIEAAFRGSATAYILKSINPVDLPYALRQAAEATVYHGVRPSERVRSGGKASVHLTERELTMLAAIARGLSNKAISSELWVTEQTVKFHLSNVYRKLGVPSRTAAVRYAHQHGLVEAERATSAA